MTGAHEHDELLRRLALGELSADDAEVRAQLERSEAFRAEWERLSALQEELAAAGGEELEQVIDGASAGPEAALDGRLAEDFFRARFKDLARPRKPRARLLPAWLLAAAAVLIGIVAIWPRADDPPPEPWIATMSAFVDDAGLEALVPTATPTGMWTLRWRHELPKRASTIYRLTLYDPVDGSELLEAEELTGAEYDVDFAPDWPGEVLWRVVALDGEDEEYAACHALLRREP